jgi:hypothetical protein
MAVQNKGTGDMKLDNMNFEITDEMRSHYKGRTDRHVGCVKRNIHHLAAKCPDIADELIALGEAHDNSKWEEPEHTPYVLITWRYKCKDDGVDFEIPAEFNDRDATFHHIKSNPHHPEYWDDDITIDCLSAADRDTPAAPVNATGMPRVAIADMCCDWHAMGLERGNTAREWADKNVNVRWNFTDEQVGWLYEFLDLLEDQNVFVD